MSKPKYRVTRVIGGFTINEIDADETVVAMVAHRESAEWLTSELNTLAWAVDNLLDKLQDGPRESGSSPRLKRAGLAASVEPQAPITNHDRKL